MTGTCLSMPTHGQTIAKACMNVSTYPRTLYIVDIFLVNIKLLEWAQQCEKMGLRTVLLSIHCIISFNTLIIQAYLIIYLILDICL